MDKFSIAIIQPNKILYDKEFLKTSSESTIKNIMKEDIQKYTEIKEVTKETYMKEVVGILHLTPKICGTTSLCHENHQNVYQLCYVDIKENNLDENKDIINGLASYMLVENTEVYGLGILLACKILENKTCEPCGIDISEMVDILYSNLIHKGIKISTDGNIEEFTFITDPMEDFGDMAKDLRWLSLNIFKFQMILFIQHTPEQKINKKMTILHGTARIFGDAYLALQTSQNTFGDITKDMIIKLLKVLSIPIKDRALTNDEIDKKRNNGELPLVINKYCILENRYKNYHMKCQNCKVKLNESNKRICTGCYRLMYCSKECHIDNWEIHKKECLFKKTPLNELLKS